jgi:hypothetical protein
MQEAGGVLRAQGIRTKWRLKLQASWTRASRPHTPLPHHFDALAVALAGLDTNSDSSSPSCRVSS